MPDINQIDTSLKLLEKDISIHTRLFEKIEQSLEKNQEIVNNISQLLKIHDLKFEEQEKINDEMFYEIEKAKNTNIEVMRKLDELANVIKALNHNKRKDDKDSSDEAKSLINELKKWQSVLVGMILVAGYIMSKISWEKVFEVSK